MKSVSVLVYNGVEKKIEEVARDYDPNWMTSLEILSDDIFLGTENNFNFFSVMKNNEAVTEEEKSDFLFIIFLIFILFLFYFYFIFIYFIFIFIFIIF